jgi:perosamine synthetase
MYVTQVLRSNRLSYGQFTEAFERGFAKAHNVNYAVFMNSGTSALLAGLQALKEKYKWRDGSEVLVPATTFVASVNVVLHAKLVPVLVDVKMDDYGMDPSLIEAKITPKTVCVMPVHVLGLPCDMGPILRIAKAHKLKVIEDSCETMFSKYEGRPVGSMGDVGCFSTYLAHFLTTGVGGFAVTKDQDLSKRIRSIMAHGRDPRYLSIDDDDANPVKVAKYRYRFESVGHSFRATELEAALGLDQLQDRDIIIKARCSNSDYLKKALKDAAYKERVVYRPHFNGRDNFPMAFPITVPDKWKVIRKLEKAGVETRELLPLLRQPAYRGCWKPQDYPVADHLNSHGLYFGVHQGLKRAQLDYVASLL